MRKFSKKEFSVIVIILYLIAVIFVSATPGKSDDEFLDKIKQVLLRLAFIDTDRSDIA